MPYCTIEEAWGADFKDASYYAKVNAPSVPPKITEKTLEQPPGNIHTRIPPSLAQNGLNVTSANDPPQIDGLDNYFPSYSGGVPSVNSAQKMQSKIVPYEVKFPDSAKRNYLYPVENQFGKKKEDDDDSVLDMLEDNDHDIRHIDMQRRVKPEYEPNYLTSEDYFLYKKYLKLAEKYKQKLRKKYKNFIEEDGNQNVLENFSNINMDNFMKNSANYSTKDVIIFIIVGIFIIFSLDIFVKMGMRMKN